MNFWSDKAVIVTGGAGFLGQYVVRKLKERGCKRIFVPRSQDYNLVDLHSIKRMFDDFPCDMVIHLAARVGGIGANRKYPAIFFYENLIMGVQLMEEARWRKIEKFVTIGTVCCYPKYTPVPFKEKDIWNGYPEETNAPYGLAKKMLLVQSQAYRQQYGFNSIFLLPVNLYGPGDNFDLETSHVIPAMIRKFYEAKENYLPETVLWGDSTPTREFLYVEDAAEGILLAAEKYNKSDPVNLGTGFDIRIKDLAEKIKALIGYEGKIVWDTSKLNGQPQRRLDVEKAKIEFGFKTKISLEEGLRKTIESYSRFNLSLATVYG